MEQSLTLDDVKQLITFCRKERVSKITVAGVQVEFSPVAAIESIPFAEPTLEESEAQRSKREREYLDTLLHSAQ